MLNGELMHLRTKFLIILLLFLALNVAVVAAGDVNSTDGLEMINDTQDVLADEGVTVDSNSTQSTDDNSTNNQTEIVKTVPKITISSKNVKSKDTISIYLKNSSGSPLKNKKLNIVLNNKKSLIYTNSKGVANLNVNLAAKTYKLTIAYDGDNQTKSLSKSFNIKVSKLSTKITPHTNFVIRGKYLYFYLYDQRNDPVAFKKLILKLKGKKYTKTTNKNGRVALKIKLYNSKYSIKANFKGDNQYKSSSKSLKFYVVSYTSMKIENSKLLTKGYLRFYLNAPSVYKKTIKFTISNKKFTKKTTSEGIVVIKPNVAAKTYIVKAQYSKYWTFKRVKCVEGKVKDPLKENISLKNGVPDIDVMPGNYVMGNDNAKYTLTKAQYREVLKRDSHCLFLNNKLTKFTFFKTKNHPNTYHILKRAKWNVIERAINVKLVSKNKANYWPGEITVSLKGKSYSYPEVRDVQSNGYNCGPTSASMCSQVLKNYFCEKYLAKIMKTNREGTKCPLMIKALEKNNFACSYFYKSTFNDALNELKKGGCALIFHANRHYVSILDISKDGKKVLVSNSYGTYDNIGSKWIKVSYMKNKFSPQWDESLIVRLNYGLSESVKNSVNCYYNSMGANWVAKNTNQKMGLI